MIESGLSHAALIELGLSSYEAKAYLALIQRESFTAAELATLARIPRQRSYDVLAGLVAKSLARDLPGSVSRYAALSPDAAVERLLSIRRGALHELEASSRKLASQLHTVWAAGREEDAPLEFTEVLREPSLLAERFHDLQARAQRQLLTFSKPPYVVVNNTIGLAATKRVARRGGDVRSIYERSLLDETRLVEETWRFMRAGEQARVVDAVPMKMCLVDHRRVLFSLTDPAAGRLTATNILIDHQAMAQSMTMAFELLWHSATPFEAMSEAPRAATRRSR
ncbi:MAG: TrmB family transcriptional regulator [Jatrophihabitantaceae bacterium]